MREETGGIDTQPTHTHIEYTQFSLSEVDLSQLRSLKERVYPRIKKIKICHHLLQTNMNFFFHAKQIKEYSEDVVNFGVNCHSNGVLRYVLLKYFAFDSL